MARDRLVMGVALLALTVSIIWAGRTITPSPFQFPGLITMYIDSSDGVLSGDENPHLVNIERHRRCRSRSVSKPIAPIEPSPPASPVAGS